MISNRSFELVSGLFHRVSGIRLHEGKRALVAGRLQKLAMTRGLSDIDRYVELLVSENDPDEMVRVVDKLTTNETYFFREPEHFQHLTQILAARRKDAGPFRVWSAASSSGEEGYSIAMLLADKLGSAPWEVIGTDLSTSVVDAACRGLYPLERARAMPEAYLKRYCRRGHGEYEGKLLIARELRERVQFGCANLMEPLPDIGSFDVIFLRNVLIYFELPTKEAIVRRVMTRLKPDGVLYTGHSESLSAANLGLRSLRPAVYALA
ncbi:protein-glutamate O-methyltransferase CheR [Ideonella sp. DXS22W]|uniref:protein-glutamate O-methyltransferase n=1 Tax=Pseudaquabacterium inlustre TaxID=2984192 RepID=A0ABU9CHH0_9BURK